MVKFTTLVLASLAALTAASPVSSPSSALQKRQLPSLDDLGDFENDPNINDDLKNLLRAAKSKTINHFLGEPEATKGIQALARLLGATRDDPGAVMAYSRDNVNKGWGLQSKEPANAAPKRSELKSRTSTPGAKTVKIRYGPYLVPNMGWENEQGEKGMLANYPVLDMTRPCEGNCTIIGLNAGLEYADGTNANIDTGLWLHHMVLFNVGEGRVDATCGKEDISAPHVGINATSRNSERIFASGNERTKAIFPEWGYKDVGYKLKAGDKLAALLEVMNENMEDKVVYLTMTYDFIESHPYTDDVQVVWFDIRNCGTSQANPPKGKDVFSFNYTWESDFDAEVMGSIGHLHDGGDTFTLSVNNKLACTNTAKYGTLPEYVQKNATGHHAMGATSHISDLAPCYQSTLQSNQMKKGQKWSVSANYDFAKNKGMKHESGDWDEVMGIAITFVKRNR